MLNKKRRTKRMKAAFLSVFVLLLIGYSLKARCEYTSKIDSLLKVLDKTIECQEKYSSIRILHIRKMQESLKLSNQWSLKEKYLLNKKLFDAFYAYQCDSALFYLDRTLKVANEMNDSKRIDEIKIMCSRIYTSLGIYPVSVDMLKAINRNGLSKESLAKYYETYSYVYGNIGENAMNSKYADIYRKEAEKYADSLIYCLPPKSALRMQYEESRAFRARDYVEALRINDARLLHTELGTIDYATIAFERSLVYEVLGKNDERLKYLILSAISDIQSSIKDNASLSIISQIIFEKGDIKRAYKYINKSMDDAISFNTPLRKMQLSPALRIIERSYQLQIAEQRRTLVASFCICLTLLVFLLIAVFFIYSQLKRSRFLNAKLEDAYKQVLRLKDKLLESNYIKEQYISSFLSLCSKNIEKLGLYRQLVYLKVSNKQYAELSEIVRNTDFVRQEAEEFYNNFDCAFCNIYPDFVDEFNKLLREDCQIEIKKGSRLTPELRIFALIRLGITDSAKIAQLLRYSMSTIYNYRMKIRKKAHDSVKDFEEKVKQIGSFQNESKL